ncbi:MAG: ABC transporter substrate-binding protein, partial [Proteobacteria bacterium]|nr:ABC transporter substrate-binding protein [Pseudomonadota bacterium]
RYTAGVKGVEAFLDPELVTSPENNPPADAPAGTFIEVCAPETQALYDAIWTQLKK